MPRTEDSLPPDLALMGLEVPVAAAIPARTADAEVGTDLPQCAAVVVHRTSANATLACLASLFEHAPGTPVALVLGAEGSAENADVQARLSTRRAVLVVTAEAGDSEVAAAEHGIDSLLLAHPQIEHVLLLSANARLRPGALQAMRACAQKHRAVGAVGCRVVDRDGRRADERALRAPALQPPGIARGHGEPSRGATEVETDLVDAGCLLVDAAALRLGVRRKAELDPDLADQDLCLRLAAIGRRVWLTQAATVECDVERATRRRGRFAARCAAQVRLSRRRLSRLAFARWFAWALFVHPLRWLARGGLVGRLPAYCAGLLRGLRSA